MPFKNLFKKKKPVPMTPLPEEKHPVCAMRSAGEEFYPVKAVEEFETKFPGKHAVWGKKFTKAFKEWYSSKYAEKN